MKQFNTLATLILTVALLYSCGTEEATQEDSSLTRQIHKVDLTEVRVMPLELKTFQKQLISNGKVEARNKSKISFQSTGVVEAINVKEGQRVEKGAVLASLNTDQLSLDLERAKLNYDKAKMDYEDKLLDFGYTLSDSLGIPESTKRTASIRSGYQEAIFNLKEAQTNYDKAVVYAPFAGRVATVEAVRYETPDKEVCTIVDDAQMSVRFSILESEISLTRVGQGVKIIPFNDSQSEYMGRVESINPVVEEKGQIYITATINNSRGKLIDGQNVRVLIEEAVASQMVVPKSAVVVRDNHDVLFRLRDSKALWTYVNIISSNSEEYIVAANADRGADLSVGDSVIISGNLNLGDGAEVKVVE